MRTWIYHALDQVINKQMYSNLYLRNHLNEVKPKDRALATHIFYGTIQNYRYCQACWQVYAKKKINKRLDVLLTMSAYQLLFLDKVPSYAIVNDAVNIAKSIHPRFAGMTNAILHKVKPIQTDSIALKYSIPDWLYSMWQAQYGLDKAKQMAESSVQILPLYVRRNTLKISESDFMSCKDFEVVKDPIYIYKGVDYFHHAFYQKGYMSAQDIGSYEIANFVGAKENEILLDCCAAPGTKSMAMAQHMKNLGRIDACDLHEHRVQLILQDAKRLGISIVNAKVQDATNLDDYGLYDRILCDVPCSGYGVLSRKPDIKLTMKPEDMDVLIPLQYGILTSTCKHVKKQGYLVYSTCTMNKKENEKQIQRFLKEHLDYALIEEKTIFSNCQQDGFYMAKLQRR